MADPDVTPEERRNGWDAESLAKYRAERERSQLEHADWTRRPQPLPDRQNNRYSPLRWRRG